MSYRHERKEFLRCQNVGMTNACHTLMLNAPIATWGGLTIQRAKGKVIYILTNVTNGRQHLAQYVEAERD